MSRSSKALGDFGRSAKVFSAMSWGVWRTGTIGLGLPRESDLIDGYSTVRASTLRINVTHVLLAKGVLG